MFAISKVTKLQLNLGMGIEFEFSNIENVEFDIHVDITKSIIIFLFTFSKIPSLFHLNDSCIGKLI